MEFYGPYEVVRDIASGPDSTVYLARDRDRPAEDSAVKVRRPFDLDPLSPATHPRIEAFRLGVERQAALAGTPGLVRIERSDVDARGAWCAWKFYRHSLRWIIEGRTNLPLENFYFLVRSIVEALEELRRASGGPHGNLHAGNVLIEPATSFRRSAVALTDLAPLPADTDAASKSDLRALGLIIYQLVRAPLEQFHGNTGPASWPIPNTYKEWPALFGEQADGWRTLCNALLDRELDLARTNLRTVATEIEALAPPPRTLARCGRSVARSAPVSVPAALLVMACFYLHWGPNSESPPWLQRVAGWVGNAKILPQEWRDCRNEYFGWFSNFLTVAVSKPRGWSDDAYLQLQVLTPIENARSNQLTLENLSFLANAGKDVKGARANLAAWKSILKLAAGTRQNLEGWPARTNLDAAATRFRALKWDGPAEGLSNRAAAVRCTSNTDWQVVILNVLKAEAPLKEMKDRWAEVEGTAQRIEKDFPELIEVSTFLRETVRFTSKETDLEEAAKRLLKQHELADEASNFVTQTWGPLLEPLKATNLPPKGLAVLSWEHWKEKVSDALLRQQQSPETLAVIKEFMARRFPDCPMLEKDWLARVKRLGIDPDATKELSTILERLHGFFVELTNFLPALAFSMPTTNDRVALIVQRIAQEQRDKALVNALIGMTNRWHAVFPPSEPGETNLWADVSGVRDRFTNWQAALKVFSAEVPEVPKLLAAGEHDEALDLWQEWKRGGVLGDLEKEPDLQTVFEPLRELEEIAARPDLDPNALVARVLYATPQTPLALPWAAWKRLGTNSAAWPTNLAQMQSEAQMQRSLHERVSRLEGAAAEHRAGLQKQLEQTAVNLLLAGFIVLTNDKFRAEARHMFESNGLPGIIGMSLPPEAQFNSQLLDLRLTNLAAQNSNEVSKLHADFVRRVREWDLDKSVAGFSNLEALSFTNWTQASEVPASILQARARWNRKEGESEVTFKWEAYQLRFFLVQPPDSKPFYLSETEVPVGLFADWATKVIGTTNLRANFKWLTNSRGFARSGIQTWEPGVGSSPIKVAASWQTMEATNFFWGTNRPEFTNLALPNSSHPVNYVPAQVARFLAESMGFRLPTRAEWLDAYLSLPHGPANLRDPTWREQQQYVETINHDYHGVRLPPWPDAEAFIPSGTDIPKGQHARVTNLGDGLLWFAPVKETNTATVSDSSRQFLHLVGNVAEYACEVTPGKTNYFVVGGSALSDPTLSATNAYPLTGNYDRIKGYSDVGFRLALEGEESPALKFQTLVHRLNYLARSR